MSSQTRGEALMPARIDFFGHPVEIRGRSRGTYQLKLEGDLITYNEFSVFDENTGEWDSIQLQLPCQLFADALREFRRRGHGKIKAKNCEVEIRKQGGEVRILLHGPGYYTDFFSPHTLYQGISFWIPQIPPEVDRLFNR